MLAQKPALARVFQRELEANAQVWRQARATIEAKLIGSEIATQLGQEDAALRKVLEADRLLVDLPAGDGKARVLADLWLRLGSAQTRTAPQQALRSLDAALRQYRQSGHVEGLPGLLLARSKVHLALADPAAAAADLHQAVDIVENRRPEISSERHSISYWETLQAIFDSMIELQVGELDSPRVALHYAERARARMLLERVTTVARLGGQEFADLDQVLGELAPDTVFVEFTLLEDSLLVWRMHRGRVEFFREELDRRALCRQIGDFRNLLRYSAGRGRLQAEGSQLYDKILAAALRGTPRSSKIVLLPDRCLYGLPFAALSVSGSDKFLLDDFGITVAPSLALYLELMTLSEVKAARRQNRSVMTVFDPKRDRVPPSISTWQLPSTAAEAATVGKLYDRSFMLTGNAATVENFLMRAGDHSVVHIAVHALSTSADAESALVLSDHEISSAGLLTVEDLSTVDLSSTELVFLASCRTSSVFKDENREGISGLVRPFLAAGVPAVVGTFWEVSDRDTAQISAEFHRHLVLGATPSEALRHAQQASLRTNNSWTWAAFQSYGDWSEGWILPANIDSQSKEKA